MPTHVLEMLQGSAVSRRLSNEEIENIPSKKSQKTVFKVKFQRPTDFLIFISV